MIKIECIQIVNMRREPVELFCMAYRECPPGQREAESPLAAGGPDTPPLAPPPVTLGRDEPAADVGSIVPLSCHVPATWYLFCICIGVHTDTFELSRATAGDAGGRGVFLAKTRLFVSPLIRLDDETQAPWLPLVSQESVEGLSGEIPWEGPTVSPWQTGDVHTYWTAFVVGSWERLKFCRLPFFSLWTLKEKLKSSRLWGEDETNGWPNVLASSEGILEFYC